MKKLNVAILGATGAVGTELLNVLESRKFPIGKLKLLALEVGTTVPFMGTDHVIEEASGEAFKDIQVAFFAGGPISKVMAPEAVKAGAVVIDNSSTFRLDPDVPLVVPEVNVEDIDKHNGIIANPNCSTIIMVLAINPIHKHGELKRVIVSTCQAVSGAGNAALEEMMTQYREVLEGREAIANILPVASLKKHYPIAFNLIPQIDVFFDDGYTKEEMKLVLETRKIMGLPELAISATTVRCPVVRSHSEVINLETERRITRNDARRILSQAPGVIVQDDPAEQLYPMPAYVSGRDEVFVGRIREDTTVPAGLSLWVVGDQIRKGAALNAVQIAEQLIARNRI
ncbi:aspartate-semialdehyde dehydrogenase [Xanthobacteraceae bacterium Astr-EGSB]|uniref:aspartate-semialdehyde dehydrogenase n=1 Tax=Astrobacterium formosum TaxID=3069710 RepID=UPI0027B47218|nr:aspartate-semialdehyde dehydrogenase [Xanthobacteraceae bacterium Astr-EGSB]